MTFSPPPSDAPSETSAELLQASLEDPQTLAAIAHDYRQQGYKVVYSTLNEGEEAAAENDPDLDEISPAALRGYRPDLLARGRSETVFVWVRSRSQLAEQKLAALAEAIAELPGWRLDVVVLPPPRPQPMATLDAQAIKRRLLQSIRLLKANYWEAALLLTVSTLEAVILRLCQREGIAWGEERPEFRALLKQLATRGALNEIEWAIAQQGLEVRDQVAHIDPNDLSSRDFRISLTQRLLLLIERLL